MAPRDSMSSKDVSGIDSSYNRPSSGPFAALMDVHRNGESLPAPLLRKTDKCSVTARQTVIDSDQWQMGAKAVRHLRRRLQLPQHAHLLRRLQDIKDERSEEEEESVEKLRQALSSRNLLAPSHDEYYTLVRFLRAHKLNIDKTVSMWEKHLMWREEKRIDETHHFEYPELDVVHRAYPCFIHGVDRQGHPLYFERLGQANPSELLKHTTLERYIQFRMKSLNWMFGVCFPAASVAAGRVIHKTTNILDCGGVSLRYITLDALTFFQAMGKLWGDNFPESLHHVYIINAGIVFRYVWAAYKHLVDPGVKDRLTVLGTDYHDHLSRFIDPSQLPADLGGTCRCSSDGGCFRSELGPWQDREILRAVRLMRTGSLRQEDVEDTHDLMLPGRIRWQSGEFKFDARSVPELDSTVIAHTDSQEISGTGVDHMGSWDSQDSSSSSSSIFNNNNNNNNSNKNNNKSRRSNSSSSSSSTKGTRAGRSRGRGKENTGMEMSGTDKACAKGNLHAQSGHNSFANDLHYLSNAHPRGLLPHPQPIPITVLPVLAGSGAPVVHAPNACAHIEPHNPPSQPPAAADSGVSPRSAISRHTHEGVRVRFSSTVDEMEEGTPHAPQQVGQQSGQRAVSPDSCTNGNAAAAAVAAVEPGVSPALQNSSEYRNGHSGRESHDAACVMSPCSTSTSSGSPIIAASPFSSTTSAPSSASPSSPPGTESPEISATKKPPPEVSPEILPADNLAALQLPASTHYPENGSAPGNSNEKPAQRQSTDKPSPGSARCNPPTSLTKLPPSATATVTSLPSQLISFILSLLAAVAMLPVRVLTRRKALDKSFSSRSMAPSHQPVVLMCSPEALNQQLSVIEEKVQKLADLQQSEASEERALQDRMQSVEADVTNLNQLANDVIIQQEKLEESLERMITRRRRCCLSCCIGGF